MKNLSEKLKCESFKVCFGKYTELIKMLKNEVAKNELKEVRHSEEWHKSGEK